MLSKYFLNDKILFFAAKAETYLNLNTENRRCFQLILFPRSISKIRDPIWRYFCKAVFRECQQSWEVWNMFQGTRKSLFIRSTMHRVVVNGQCVNIFMYSCWPALLHLLHHGTIGLWWRSPIYIIDNSSHSTAVCTLAIVMLNSSHTASPVQSVNSDPSSVLQFWHQFWKAH